MYLRETRRRNKDGSTVSYLQLAHNERHPETGSPVAKVIHNFGRADRVDREALTRLVRSISRVLDVSVDEPGVPAGDVEIVDSRRLGGTFVLDRMWERLGLEVRARTVRCTSLELDSGVQRQDAHRFYFRQRMSVSGFHFMKRLQ